MRRRVLLLLLAVLVALTIPMARPASAGAIVFHSYTVEPQDSPQLGPLGAASTHRIDLTLPSGFRWQSQNYRSYLWITFPEEFIFEASDASVQYYDHNAELADLPVYSEFLSSRVLRILRRQQGPESVDRIVVTVTRVRSPHDGNAYPVEFGNYWTGTTGGPEDAGTATCKLGVFAEMSTESLRVTSAARGETWLAQTFTAQQSHRLTAIRLKLSRQGSPGGVTIRIEKTTGGVPNGDLVWQGSIPQDQITTNESGAWVSVPVPGGHLLSPGLQYAIVIKAPSGTGPDPAVYWHRDSSWVDLYPDGEAKERSSAGVWSTIDNRITGFDRPSDFMFEQYGMWPNKLETPSEPTYGGTTRTSPDRQRGGVGHYPVNQVVSLEAIARDGHSFVRWEGDLTGTANPATVVMNADKTITAVYTDPPYLTVSTVGSGSVRALAEFTEQGWLDARDRPLEPGTFVWVWADADAGHHLRRWEGDLSGSDIGPIGMTIDSHTHITAVFQSGNPELKITHTTGGTVTPPSGTHPRDSTVGVGAQAEYPEWYLVRWEGDALGEQLREFDILMTSYREVHAVFAPDYYPVHVATPENGSLAKSPDLAWYRGGSEVTLTAAPQVGYRFLEWEIGFRSSERPDYLMPLPNQTVNPYVLQTQWPEDLWSRGTAGTTGEFHVIAKFELDTTPMTISVEQAEITVNEGSLAVNPGEYTPGTTLSSAGLGSLWDWPAEGRFEWRATPPRGPHEWPITIKATHPVTGEEASASFTLYVLNVPPTLTGPLGQQADAGVAKTFALGSFTDPGVNDNPWTVVVDWGDTQEPNPIELTYQTQGPIQGTHTYAREGTYTVEVSVSDRDGGVSDTEWFTVTVASLQPVLVGLEDRAADEGTAKSFDLGSFSGGTGPWTVRVNWGDGSAIADLSALSEGPISGDHTYAVDGSYEIEVTVIDSNGTASETAKCSITVHNVAPVVTPPLEAQTVPEMAAVEIALGSFTDPGADAPWTVSVDWGYVDNIPDVFEVGAPGPIGPRVHTFPETADGPRTVTVSVSDGQASGSTSFTVTVLEVNTPPVLQPIEPITVAWGYYAEFTAVAHDSDFVAGQPNKLTFELIGAPGGTLNPDTGAFRWRTVPASLVDQPEGGYVFTVRVTDDGEGPLYAEQLVRITVIKRTLTLEYTGDTSGAYSDLTNLAARTVELLPRVEGEEQEFRFTLGEQTVLAPVQYDSSLGDFGFAEAPLLLGQAPGSYLLATTFIPTATVGLLYEPASVTTTFTITPKDLTVVATGVNRAYDGSTDAKVILSIDALTDDKVVAVHSSANFDSKDVGNDKPVSVSGISISGADAGKYKLLNTTAGTTAGITPLAITGTFTSEDKTYDRTAVATVASRYLTYAIPDDNVSLTGGTAAFADKNVGTAKTVALTGATLTGADAGNYSLTSVAAATADITARAVAPSIVAKDKVYDGTTAATLSSQTVTGVLSPDVVTLEVGAASFADKNVGTWTVTATTLSLGGANAGNYALSAAKATDTADITAAALTIAGAVAEDKVYDGNDTATVDFSGASLSGVIGGDPVHINSAGYSAAFADKNVGNSKPVTVLGLALSGAAADNYTVTQPSGLTADITALAITGAFTAEDKTYDRTAVATVASRYLTGAIPDDDVSLTGGTAAFADKNVGTDKTVALTGATLTGADAGNYSLTSVAAATADITARAVAPSIVAKDKVYDGTTAATLSSQTVTGVLSPDVVTLEVGAASFADKNVGTWTVTATTLSLGGANAGNYALSAAKATDTAEIAPLDLGLSGFWAAAKIWDGTASVISSGFSDDRVPGDNLVFSGVVAFEDANVGSNKTVYFTNIAISGGADAPNYILVTSSGEASASITRRPTILQYTGEIGGQYSDPAGLEVVLSDANGWGELRGRVLTFTLGTQTTSAITGSSGVAAPDLILDQSPGSKELIVRFTGDEHFAPATVSQTYSIIPEQGVVTYIGAEFVTTGSSNSSKATIPLAFTIRDVTAVPEHPYYDAYAGDVRNARLRIFIYDDNDKSLALLEDIVDLVPTLVDDGDTTIGVWAGQYEVDIGGSDARFYWIEFHLDGGYYLTYEDNPAPVLVTVAKPQAQSIAGGGYVMAQSPAGSAGPDPGSRVSFGFNVRYNRNVTNVRGQVNIIFSRNGETYQIKSTSLESLKISSGDGSQAELYSKVNLINLTTGETLASSGDTRLDLRLTDGGEGSKARGPDTISITLWNVRTGELLFCSSWEDTQPHEQELCGGSIQVRDEKGDLK